MKKSLEASPETERFGHFNGLDKISVPPPHAIFRWISPGLSRRHSTILRLAAASQADEVSHG